jgi:amidase
MTRSKALGRNRRRHHGAGHLFQAGLLRRSGFHGCTLIALATSQIASAQEKVFELSEATITDISDALASGALSSVELTVLYLNRIDVYDRHGMKLNSVIVDNPDALAEAARSDALRAKGLAPRSLEGVPFTVKDSYKVKGLTLAAGSPAFAKMIANEDAFTVARLREAGAVLLGKTNMPPLAAGGMQRGVYGRAESPYNADYLTAAWNSGSSNGSGTATGASFASFGMGEETVSSGRSPSSNNGLVAYTPSWGVISIRGNWPLFPIKDVVVPMTRSMDDMFRVLDVVVADDPVARGDFWREQKAVPVPASSAVRPASYASLARPDALKGKRIGVPTMYIGKDPTGKPIPVRKSILTLWEKAADDLRKLGATVIEVDFPLMHNYDMDRPDAQSFVSRGFIPAEWFPPLVNGQRAGPNIEFEKLNPYAWSNFVTDNGDPGLPDWRGVDPAQVFPNPPGSVDAGRSGPARDYVRSKATILAGVTPYADLPKFAEGMRGLARIRQVDFEQWLDAQKLDLIVFPANADVGAAKADVDEAAYDHATSNGVARSTTNAMLRHLGIPSVSVSMGIMQDTKMPVNLTFAGKAYDDDALLSYGYAYEAATLNRRAPTRIQPLADERIAYVPSKSVPPARRSEAVPPQISIDSVAKIQRGVVQLSGRASDESGLSYVRVYLNGHKVYEGQSGAWNATVPMDSFRTWVDAGDTAFTVTALAKDKPGNAMASVARLAIPK